MSGEFKHNLHKNGIKLRNVKSYSPWANGEVERLNRSLNRANQAEYAKNKNYGEEHLIAFFIFSLHLSI